MLYIPMSPFGVIAMKHSLSVRSFSQTARTQTFAEWFKYGVTCSPLKLPPALPATPMAESHRQGLSLLLLGRLSNSQK